jgi:hypothetical protein
MTMKKVLIASALFFSAVAVFGHTPADAAEPLQPAVQTVVRPPAGWVFKQTYVKGEITVPPVSQIQYHNYATPGSLSGIQCSNIVAIASSKEQKPPPPGGFVSGPVWTKSVQATGTYSTGKCSYIMTIPAAPKEFSMSVGFMGEHTCTVQFTGAGTPYISVPFGTTKVENFSAGEVWCTVIG